MTKAVTPSVYHLATTTIVPEGVRNYLSHMGAPDWTTDSEDPASYLTELAGRSCYRSFGVGLNKNVTRVREGNRNYVGNSILAQKHGSVLEHACDTFAVCDVSRIVTHELVRHRQGTAFSQESGRYVRIDDLSYYIPDALRDPEFLASVHEDLVAAGETQLPFESWRVGVIAEYNTLMTRAGTAVTDFERMMGLDHVSNFDKKKKLQSAIRRAVPFGMASNIIVTANHRAWRHICSVRTHSSAEEEIRLIQYKIFLELERLHPNIYQDARLVLRPGEVLPVDIPEIVFENEKV